MAPKGPKAFRLEGRISASHLRLLVRQVRHLAAESSAAGLFDSFVI